MFAIRTASTRFAGIAARNVLQNMKMPRNKMTSTFLAPSITSSIETSRRSIVSIAEVSAMPKEFSDMDNDTILKLALTGIEEAIQERLIRDIMAVDQCSWEDAQPRFKEIEKKNQSGMMLFVLPYQIGFTIAVVTGFASFPLCFHEGTALLFNEAFVTTDVPHAKDMETVLEIGAWTWNWMEPPLGQISFFLLTLQFARSQIQNMGVKPYTGWLKRSRADKLHSTFPQYNEHVIKDYSHSVSLIK